MGAPFSSSTDYEMWAEDWCWRCANDVNKDCPILEQAIAGRVPQEWTPLWAEYPHHRYFCRSFAKATS